MAQWNSPAKTGQRSGPGSIPMAGAKSGRFRRWVEHELPACVRTSYVNAEWLKPRQGGTSDWYPRDGPTAFGEVHAVQRASPFSVTVAPAGRRFNDEPRDQRRYPPALQAHRVQQIAVLGTQCSAPSHAVVGGRTTTVVGRGRTSHLVAVLRTCSALVPMPAGSVRFGCCDPSGSSTIVGVD